MSAAQMSGPEHFLKAEEYLRWFAGSHMMPGGRGMSPETVDRSLAAAQAHATLALVAVTAELASHTAPPAMRREHNGTTYVDDPWKALLNPSNPEEETSEPPY